MFTVNIGFVQDVFQHCEPAVPLLVRNTHTVILASRRCTVYQRRVVAHPQTFCHRSLGIQNYTSASLLLAPAMPDVGEGTLRKGRSVIQNLPADSPTVAIMAEIMIMPRLINLFQHDAIDMGVMISNHFSVDCGGMATFKL